MALSLATLQARRDALQLAMASGERRVSYQDKSVEYRDFDEMRRALQWLDGEIAKLNGDPVAARQIRMVTRDGYGGGTSSST